jgi:hypothetical protein
MQFISLLIVLNQCACSWVEEDPVRDRILRGNVFFAK